MVANLLKLRLLVLKNSLLRSTWQLIAVIFGALYGLGVMFGVTIGLIALSGAPVSIASVRFTSYTPSPLGASQPLHSGGPRVRSVVPLRHPVRIRLTWHAIGGLI